MIMKRLLSLLAIMAILAVQVIAFLPQPVYAATETLAISSEGTDSVGTASYTGGAGNYTVLNSDDGDTSYLRASLVQSYRSYKVISALPAGSTINSVTMYGKLKVGSAAGNVLMYFYSGGTRYEDTFHNPTSWTLYSKTWTINPATGSAWTEAQINAGEFGFRLYAIDTSVYVTYAYVVVDYNSAPTVTTQAVTAITATTATGNGNVTSDGGSTITSRGTCLSTSSNPTVTDTVDNATGTTGAFTTSIDSLTKNTTYHVRAFATNSIGTGYGSDVTFTTLTDPTISTVAASQIAATTARLNSNVTFDGREACTVAFVYTDGTGFADYAAIKADAGSVETAVSSTYVIGNLPYLDITGLTVLTEYSFAVKITNSVSTAYGSVLTFTTKSGISEPASLTALPTSTTISLIWTKGSGSTYSLLRYSPAEYPATTTSGSMGYLGTGNSVKITGLTPGTTYYWSAWGMSGGTYSDNYTTTLCTTLAYDDAAGSDVDIEVPAENSLWMQTPDTSKLDNVPLFNAAVNLWNENYGIPDVSIWYFIWLMIGIGGGILIYTRSSQNLVATFAAELIWFGIGSVMGLIWMWIVFVFIIIALGFIVFGHRH